MKDNLTAHYILMNDIDASATHTWNDNGTGGYYGFEPVGGEFNRFAGSLEGNGYCVYNLFINRPNAGFVGLFGSTDGNIRNVGLENIEITGKYYVGALAGYIGFDATVVVENCHAVGDVTGSTEEVGLLIGRVGSGDTLRKAYSHGTVTILNASSCPAVGGLVGFIAGDPVGKVFDSFSTASVSSYQRGGD